MLSYPFTKYDNKLIKSLRPIMQKYIPFFCNISQSQIYQFKHSFIIRKNRSVFNNFTETSIDYTPKIFEFMSAAKYDQLMHSNDFLESRVKLAPPAMKTDISCFNSKCEGVALAVQMASFRQFQNYRMLYGRRKY